ncbi:RdgB/HAM1 family non-canonical purine NTP pyrophosphatase [Megalodesulfovibrio gigas]|uniref:dITP/XTP pyrophosphatase n=1 Tax=Megalodesulfovibrio gigas (strain ATCC 19364 / DSM 1382 / NCIMB 9332 / VKM B-1759) TaxID=1121448 RepID=T2G7N3_MEGG1|nr:RdgB/HAM1 family non-canonical purine NTP pyrophosphatase [Megalodesulfovibrio gigas]AGW12575.1 putative nucleoside-triphosphatase [Megalodesulfovibrio gigas DSM 1382 = ATCC 19364]
MPHTLVLATRNPGKLAELQSLLSALDVPVTVLGLDAFADMPDVEETGDTFSDNALLKARAVAAHTGLPAIADDSGLVVDALQGAPGVRSARYGEPFPVDATGAQKDLLNTQKLLHALTDVPDLSRSARFVTVVALASPDGAAVTAQGSWQGRILHEPRGCNGFGYDPVFFDEDAGCTAAELSPQEKNARSHRGQALRHLAALLPAFLAEHADNSTLTR